MSVNVVILFIHYTNVCVLCRMNCKSLVLLWDIEVCGDVSKYNMAFLCQGMIIISEIKHVFSPTIIYMQAV